MFSSNKLYERHLQAENRSHLYPAYDSMDRLLAYQRGTLASGGASITTPISLPGANTDQAYNLDGLGNWQNTTIAPVGGSAATQNRTHNKLNEVTQFGATAVLYDHGNNSGVNAARGNGNIADDGTRTYAYDAFNRLATVKRKSDGATVGQYVYDALGRRVRKVISNGGISGTVTNATTRFLYDAAQCVEERDGSNNPTKQYVWGQYIDELIQQRNSPASSPADFYLLSDLLYRSTALTDAAGAIAEAHDTDAYGNTLIYSAAGTGGNWWADNATTTVNPICRFIFTGREYDPETQIYFYRARYYHPPLGRFLSRDPWLYIEAQNLYEYVRSSPCSWGDSFGLQSGLTLNPSPSTQPSSGPSQSWLPNPSGLTLTPPTGTGTTPITPPPVIPVPPTPPGLIKTRPPTTKTISLPGLPPIVIPIAKTCLCNAPLPLTAAGQPCAVAGAILQKMSAKAGNCIDPSTKCFCGTPAITCNVYWHFVCTLVFPPPPVPLPPFWLPAPPVLQWVSAGPVFDLCP